MDICMTEGYTKEEAITRSEIEMKNSGYGSIE